MEVLNNIQIAPAWAGHPVGFDLVTYKGRQFVAFYDHDRKMTVGQRSLQESRFELMRLEGRWLDARGRLSTDLEWDTHNSITMTVDRNDHIHLCGNMHVDPLIYFRTSRSLDITSFARIDYMVGKNEDRCTYPRFMSGPERKLVFRYRDGMSGNGVDYYNVYDEGTQSWTRLVDVPILDGMDLMNAYARQPELGPDNQYHMIWMWRDTPDCSTNHDISYATSQDLVNWSAGDGSPLPLSITAEASTSIIDPVPPGGGLSNMCASLGYDSKDRPVVSYHKNDEKAFTQAYAARLENGDWKIHKLSDWDYHWDFSGNGSIDTEITLGAVEIREEAFLAMPWWHARKGSGIWKIDESTLQVVGSYPDPEPDLPEELSNVVSDLPGMGVRTTAGRGDTERKYWLRWETLERNRDQPRDEIPPPSDLVLYEVKAYDTV
ncbi:TPA: hypothetical protein DCE37_09130 [Candidatus Latescibacteria bacterium]|nr:hypothetical protein [Candidatus Latescibacterota bacterium]